MIGAAGASAQAAEKTPQGGFASKPAPLGYPLKPVAIVEVFINGGRQTVARVMYPPAEDLGIEAITAGRASVDVWQMKSIWGKQAPATK